MTKAQLRAQLEKISTVTGILLAEGRGIEGRHEELSSSAGLGHFPLCFWGCTKGSAPAGAWLSP